MTEELLKDFEPYITELTLLPSDGGRFEVRVDDDLIYSKKATGRHAEYSQVADSVRNYL
ncbi:MAG: selenoprotein [Caldilineae bacterium]|nr:Rdx family protein [Anaerolineae bacterium]MCB0200046.1 Rdx family protein [Anaerolineae bacterium]MCB0205359.1 Rdx family protein [Anaerolineae bacterium]MCB0252975.1 Rdx family protein [Anaerolineae bacterium]MCB9155177.1 selenoprotein [Caldilineae bacterium]